MQPTESSGNGDFSSYIVGTEQFVASLGFAHCMAVAGLTIRPEWIIRRSNFIVPKFFWNFGWRRMSCEIHRWFQCTVTIEVKNWTVENSCVVKAEQDISRDRHRVAKCTFSGASLSLWSRWTWVADVNADNVHDVDSRLPIQWGFWGTWTMFSYGPVLSFIVWSCA